MTNSKSTKRSLLMSAMSMLLCVSMLLGTTFAWFTDTVTSANNIIKSGNLDIELDYWNGTEWKTVQGASDILTNKLWEPGVTEVAYLRLKNAGSLALKYQLGVNIVSEKTGTNVAGDKFKLSDYIYFDVVEGVDGEKTPYTRETVKNVTTQKTKISAGYTKVSEMEAGSKPLYLALVVHMPTTVTNEANHNGEDIPEIALGINVFADQLTSESDSFGNDYDDLAFVPVANVDFLDDTNITLLDDSAMDLDVAYSFKTTEDEVAAAASGYRYWHADFVVSASKEVKANSIALAGYYDAYAQATNTVGKWIALEPDSDIAANTQIRLLEYMGVTGNYEELCQYIPEFLCGAIDLDGSNYGNTLTVELRLYETYSEEECLEIFGYTSKNEETGEYITIGKFEHTFGGEYKKLADGTNLFKTDDGETILYDVSAVTTSAYAIPEDVDTIGNYVFSTNSNITEVTLASTVTSLGRGFDSSAVKKVVLNEGLEQIDSRAFRSTTNLEQVDISSTVKTIADNAFQKSGIKKITIPATVETIGETAFGASLIEEVIIEGNTSIQGYAFRGCTKLNTVTLNGDDVTFIKSTLNGRNSMWICNGESNNPNTSKITFNVKNETVAARVKAAMGAEKFGEGYNRIFINGVECDYSTL